MAGQEARASRLMPRQLHDLTSVAPSGSLHPSGPIIVKVLPLPVWPYAKMHTL
jgi:hypothetical protein